MRLSIISVLFLAVNAFSMRLPLQMDASVSSSLNSPSFMMNNSMPPTDMTQSSINFPDTPTPPPSPTPTATDSTDFVEPPTPAATNIADDPTPVSTPEIVNDDAADSPSPAPAPAPTPYDFAYAPTPDEVFPAEAPSPSACLDSIAATPSSEEIYSPGPAPIDSGSIAIREDGTILSGPFAQAGGSGGRCDEFNKCEDAVWATCVPGWIPVRQNEFYWQCLELPVGC